MEEMAPTPTPPSASNDRSTTPVVGSKFHPDGSWRRFPGYSVISFLDPTSSQAGLLHAISRELEGSPLGSLFAFLPRESFHVTLMDLVCDQDRRKSHWFQDRPLDLPFREVGAVLGERVARVDPEFCPRFRFQGLYWPETSLMPILQAEDEAMVRDLWQLREHLSRASGIRHPGHEDYGFHITLAYRLFELEDQERELLEEFLRGWGEQLEAEFEPLELAPPELVYFPDMTRFIPVPPATRGSRP